jgi:hypothetical protein
MVGAEFAKMGKTFNLIHQASQLKRKAVIATEPKLTYQFSKFSRSPLR